MACSCAHTARVRALARTSSHVHCVKSRRYIVRLHVATVLRQRARCVTEIGYGLMWILTLTYHTVAVHLNLFKHMHLCTTCVPSCKRARGSVQLTMATGWLARGWLFACILPSFSSSQGMARAQRENSCRVSRENQCMHAACVCWLA
jgi:hypothetical protein